MKRARWTSSSDEIIHVAAVQGSLRDASGHVREQARRAYQLFRENPFHPGLNFKKVDEERNIYSARVGLGYRALGQFEGSDIVWFWIGPHAEYHKMI